MLKATPRQVSWPAGIESGFFEKNFLYFCILLLTIERMLDIIGLKIYRHDCNYALTGGAFLEVSFRPEAVYCGYYRTNAGLCPPLEKSNFYLELQP